MASKTILKGLPGLQKWPEKFKDVTVLCGDETFELHKVVLCSNSEFFTKAFCGYFAEPNDSQINLHEEDAETFERLVQFCYTGTYIDCTAGSEQEGERVKLDHGDESIGSQLETPLAPPKEILEPLRSTLVAGKVYIMAERLLMPAAKIFALERFRAGVDELLLWTGLLHTGPEWIDLIDRIYTDLLETDIAIKEPTCRLIAWRRLDSWFLDLLGPLMRRHGALAAGVTNYINLLIPYNHFSGKGKRGDAFGESVRKDLTEDMRRVWMEMERKQCG
ncbi:hypothetical protein PpBr36_08538 [Pyricularia pennisetigena]|uniref:hypothetical protein n=1 Tax=Pyricularia pennisetigena TaxID=1578925 RepID=UPI00115425AD|nr:hypothetical protein PpBr36_08538 [Pyricularia pennisetigena]TLS24333.1 hypothetical protein PpBr36_08538 [Pyricularia pennisetigena]